MFKIIYHKLANGDKPVKLFIDGLETKLKVKMMFSVKLLKELGYKLREPYSKHLEDGIFELRAQSGNNISRVLYFFYVGEQIILTHGFIKKTQKTPREEIDKAKAYRKDFYKQEGLSYNGWFW